MIEKKMIPLEDFFKNPILTCLRISPDGKHYAYLKPYKNRLNVHVRSTTPSSKERLLTTHKDRDIQALFWKGDDYIIFLRDFDGDENHHFYSLNIRTGVQKNLTPFEGVKHRLIDDLKTSLDQKILIASNKRDKRVFDAYSLNIHTGESLLIAKNPGHFLSWYADHNGKLKLAHSVLGLTESIFYRNSEEEEFTKVLSFPSMVDNSKVLSVPSLFDKILAMTFTSNNKDFYILSNIGRDKMALEIFDPVAKKTISTLFESQDFDLDNAIYSKSKKTLLFASFFAENRIKYHFFDHKEAEHFKHLRSKFPKKDIQMALSGDLSESSTKRIIFVSSDIHPGAYYLYELKTRSLTKISDTHPWLKSEHLSPMKDFSYISRDGLKIHAYLTLPKGGATKNLPLVVKPHGGPYLRDKWGYNPEVQFLANRGFAVFQTNFRGSTGYGKKFLNAGNKEWGKKMQNDISDGVKYLVDQKIADPKKIGIYGGSYGGYATLAGLTFTPELYACGISYVGVSNLFTHYNSFPPYWDIYREQFYMQVGHPKKDKQLLIEASPLFHIDQLKAPLFIAHGANDPRVKQTESDQIVEALKAKGVDVKYMVKENEGHGFRNRENKMEFYGEMEQFLTKHLLL